MTNKRALNCLYLAAINVLLVFLALSCARGAGRSAQGEAVDMERITVAGGALPVYQFTLPEGTMFRDYAYISGHFLVDGENYHKTARARAYGNYSIELFSDIGEMAFLDFSGGETDRNAPFLVSNVFGSNTAIDVFSGEAGPNAWFTLSFPLHGSQHANYRESNFPADDASGDFYFAVGLPVVGEGNSLTYYARDITLVSADGTRRVSASGSGFDKPAFAGYTDGIPQLAREQVSAVVQRDAPRERGGSVSFTVDPSARHQLVRGFGGMSNAWNSPVLTEDEISIMYGENGLGFNIFRIILYHEPERWGELVPVARKAQGYGAIIMACPWTPPVEFKSVDSHIGGHLLREHYGAYAAHLRSFVEFMAENGVTIDIISFQNEPDIRVSYDSCWWDPEQMLDFVVNYGREIGDMLIIPGESFQFRRAFTDPVLNDPRALENFDIIGGHIYGGGLFAYPLAAERGKEVWMTEHLHNTHGNYYNDITWRAAMIVAKEINDCMAADFNAYVWWYLKRYYSMIGDGEFDSVESQVTNRGYIMSHFAHYATGKQRIGVQASGNPLVLATAYGDEAIHGDGSLSMVIVNTGSRASRATIRLPGRAASAAAIESSENGAMQAKPVSLGLGRTTARIRLAPQSIVSVRFSL